MTIKQRLAAENLPRKVIMSQTDNDQDIGYFSEEAATFGDRVAAARRAASLTQENLSRKLGIKLKTLRAWEEDMSEPRANKLQMLAGVLNVSIIWLLTGEGEGVRDPWEEGAAATDDTSDLIAEFRAIRGEYKNLEARLESLEKKLSHSLKK